MQQSAVFSYLKADVCNKNIISCQHNLTPAYYNILTLHLSTTSCCVELTISEWRGVIHVLLHSCIIILTLKWETDFLNTNRLIKIFKDIQPLQATFILPLLSPVKALISMFSQRFSFTCKEKMINLNRDKDVLNDVEFELHWPY